LIIPFSFRWFPVASDPQRSPTGKLRPASAASSLSSSSSSSSPPTPSLSVSTPASDHAHALSPLSSARLPIATPRSPSTSLGGGTGSGNVALPIHSSATLDRGSASASSAEVGDNDASHCSAFDVELERKIASLEPLFLEILDKFGIRYSADVKIKAALAECRQLQRQVRCRGQTSPFWFLDELESFG
jgi:hypothetical protein